MNKIERTQHTPGPWFIWKERAMQDEGMSREEVDFEILGYDHFEVMAGKPIGHVSRSRIIGCHTVVTLDEHDFGGNEDEGRQTALANARLIAAAPDLLSELRKARAALKEQLEILIQSHSDPKTGLITDDADLRAIESDQHLINGIDRVIDQAEGGAA